MPAPLLIIWDRHFFHIIEIRTHSFLHAYVIPEQFGSLFQGQLVYLY